MLRPGVLGDASIPTSESVWVPRLTKEGLHGGGSPGGAAGLLRRQGISPMPAEPREEEEGVTTGIPGPGGSCRDRVLQGGGGRLQPKQAQGFGQGGLHQLHLLLLHLEPLAQGLQGLLSGALAWERGRRAQRPRTREAGGFSLPAALHGCRTAARGEGRGRRGGPRASSWRAGEEAGRAPFLPPSRPPPGRADRERGGSAESARGVGTTAGAAGRVRATGPPGAARSPGKAGAGQAAPGQSGATG